MDFLIQEIVCIPSCKEKFPQMRFASAFDVSQSVLFTSSHDGNIVNDPGSVSSKNILDQQMKKCVWQAPAEP